MNDLLKLMHQSGNPFRFSGQGCLCLYQIEASPTEIWVPKWTSSIDKTPRFDDIYTCTCLINDHSSPAPQAHLVPYLSIPFGTNIVPTFFRWPFHWSQIQLGKCNRLNILRLTCQVTERIWSLLMPCFLYYWFALTLLLLLLNRRFTSVERLIHLDRNKKNRN
jgi:hypothetical protein